MSESAMKKAGTVIQINSREQQSDKTAGLNGRWHSVCALEDIAPDAGICALVNDAHIAIFRLRRELSLFAIDNYDPLGGASVLSRGIVGSLIDRVVVASPLYKHHYDLQSGECLEDDSVKLRTWPVRVHEGEVQVFA